MRSLVSFTHAREKASEASAKQPGVGVRFVSEAYLNMRVHNKLLRSRFPLHYFPLSRPFSLGNPDPTQFELIIYLLNNN